jgi:hypothetical protein
VTEPIIITEDNARQYFSLQRLQADALVEDFECRIGEYADYLREDALRAQADHVAITWVLVEMESFKIAAYMSLIADAVKLSNAEKELHKLNYPFKTIPAIKIAKLAVAEVFRQRYKGLGTYMVFQSALIATETVNDFIAARFLTVDADIEHDAGVLGFYEKLCFAPNVELSGKKRKTLSMRRDLYI